MLMNIALLLGHLCPINTRPSGVHCASEIKDKLITEEALDIN